MTIQESDIQRINALQTRVNRDLKGGFEVYTYFGRRVAFFKINDGELHHGAQEKARLCCKEYDANGGESWVRYCR